MTNPDFKAAILKKMPKKTMISLNSRRFFKGKVTVMDTGFFDLLKHVRQPETIVRFLDNSSYDELLEINVKQQTFKSVFHVSKKYAMPLTKGSYREVFIGMSEELIHPEERERFIELMNPETILYRLSDSELPGLCCEEYRFRLIVGNWHWVEMVLIAGEEYGLEPNVVRMYIFDCQSRKIRELGLTDTAVYADNNRNEMTGLLKKRAFIKDVQQRIKKDDREWCLVSIDIDNFKLFNEWYGHSEGDLLMIQIGATLLEAGERTGGTAGYFGQDDFCLLIPYDMELIGHIYEDVSALIGSRGNSSSFLPAFGICVVKREYELMDMLDRALLAAQVAKEGYHSRIRVFEKGMYSRTNAEYRVLTDFSRALKQHEIVFYLQPQCRASSGKIVGAEALARWIKPDGTVIPPDTFIPVLEKRGLISDLDLYIWDDVCRWQHDWIKSGHTPLPVSVNVSVSDILHTDLPAIFENLINKYELERNLLKIEITESSYITNTALVMETVRSLREKGFTVLMDDFGSGSSTLNMLKNLNIDVIKLDAQFLNMNESNEEKSIQILESVTNLTKTIGVPIIVEGVETKEQKDFLIDMGCRYIQGYYFYRPLPITDFESLIDDPDKIDTSGISFKANQQFRLRELLDNNIYSDTMLNSILGPCALYSWHGDDVDIVRYNEQFYEAVDVPDFSDRLTCIQRFLPKADVPRITELLRLAQRDRLNGSKGLLHFYKTDGSLTTFHMHFYYLHSEGEEKIFYGSVRNITKLSNLEKQMSLLSHISTDTVLFLSRTSEGAIRFTVLFNGLENIIGISAHELETELNGENFIDRIGSENDLSVYKEVLEHIQKTEPFSTTVSMRNANGDRVTLNAVGNYIPDETNSMDYIIILSKPAEEQPVSLPKS